MDTITKTTDSNLFIVYKLYGNMETKIHLPKKPAAGAARIGILYRSPPLKMSKICGRGPLYSVRNYCDALLNLRLIFEHK